LQRDLTSDGVAYPHAVLVAAADPDRHVALLSRRPLLSVVQHAELDFEYFGAREKVKRGLLEAQFATSAGKLTVFGVHLKSRFTDRTADPLSAKRRIGEATAIRDLISRRFPDPAHAQFVVVGDFNDDRSSKTLQRLTRLNRVHLSELLAATDSRGESWTHVYRKEDSYSRIDHILMPASLAASVPGGRARIFDGDGVIEASDHRPVIVTLEFPDKK
jgi:endonuclease/exonuclease/phosphatase family metal-dependent hydrolase